MTSQSPLVFTFGILGNIVSFIVFLAPVPTFIRVFKKKSTEGFQSIPYVFALFSAMIWIYYASLKSGEMLLITINGFGCVIETIYLAMYITYAPKQARKSTLRLLLLVNFGGFCAILGLSHFLAQGPARVKVLGWVCVAFSVSVFAAPLSIMRLVIRTKSVEFMPFSLSFFLTLSAVMWLFYGLLLKDLYVAAPNILGFTFGVVQMILYAIFRNSKPVVLDEQKISDDIVKEISITVLPATSDEAKAHVQQGPEQEPVSPIGTNTATSDDHIQQISDDKHDNVDRPRPCHIDVHESIEGLASKHVPVLVQCEV